MSSRAWKCWFVGLALTVLAAGCGSSARHDSAPSTTRVSAAPATTLPGAQTSGPRTVLSPVGLNVRAAAKRSAPVLGTAEWGSVLKVLGHTTANGGWFEVRGATHTGWISGDSRLSAAGKLLPYTSNTFSVLYPPTWTHKPSGSKDVVFTSGSGADSIVVATATPTSTAQLARGRVGYSEASRRTVTVCGATGELVTYTRAGAAPPDRYLLQMRLIFAARHALGFEATLSDLGIPLQVFSNFLASVTFPSPRCTGR